MKSKPGLNLMKSQMVATRTTLANACEPGETAQNQKVN
jgi:hypothetical protein